VERSPKLLQTNPHNRQTIETSYLNLISAPAALLLPLVFREEIHGLAQVISPPQTFTDQDISIAQLLTDQAAGAMTNAWLYEALKKANKLLSASNEELDAFAHTVAHDLKSPLGAILGFADLLFKEYETLKKSDIDEFLNYIICNGQKMRSIIDGLLTLASVRREQVQFNPLPMAVIVADVQSRLTYTMREYQAQIVIATNILDSVGYVPWVEEIWANYIGNAIKYGGSPPVITLGSNRAENGMIRYWVRDNGRGLSAADQRKLFTPFTRLGHSDISGHGLGLSIVQRITNRLGGQVGVISEVGKGCEFFFTLPATTK
jgi:signal transduction histidine kinase